MDRTIDKSDPDQSFQEAQRRIERCISNKDSAIYFTDLNLERFPDELRQLTWLRRLNAYGCPPPNVEQVAPLINVEFIAIGSLQYSFDGIEFVKGWTQLKHLEILTPSVFDISPLASCCDLEWLSISSRSDVQTKFDFSIIESLKNAKFIHFRNVISDNFSPITKCCELKSLSLLNSDISSLSGFCQLKKLESFTAHNSLISDLSPLRGLKLLASLDVSNTQVSDLAPLISSIALSKLDVSGTNVHDLTPLAELYRAQVDHDRSSNVPGYNITGSGLRTLSASKTPVADLAPVSQIETLERLDVSDTRIRDIAPLRQHKSLQSLSIKRTDVSDISVLHANSRLHHLFAGKTLIKDLGPFSVPRNLQSLDVSDTKILNVNALAGIKSLNWLQISNTPVSDLGVVRGMPACRSLFLRGSQVADIRMIFQREYHHPDRGEPGFALDFRDTPAARSGPKWAELSALAEQNTTTCFLETRDYVFALQRDAAKLDEPTVGGHSKEVPISVRRRLPGMNFISRIFGRRK